MSKRFAGRVPKLAAIAARALRWSPDMFWAATPAELAMSLADPSANPDVPLNRSELEQLLELERHGHR